MARSRTSAVGARARGNETPERTHSLVCVRIGFQGKAQWDYGTSRAVARISTRRHGVGSRMADKSGSGATVGGRSSTTELSRPRRNFPPSGAVCTRAAKIHSRKKRIAHSRHEFPCAGLRPHVKEASQCDSKRDNRAAIRVTARVDSERAVRMCRGSRKQSEIARATRRRVFLGQNNIPICFQEDAGANHPKNSYRFDDRLAFLAAMGGAAFALERQRPKLEN